MNENHSDVGLLQMLQRRQSLDGLPGLGLGQAQFIQGEPHRLPDGALPSAVALTGRTEG